MAGDRVRLVFVTPPAVVYKWRGLPIDGIVGLEEGLIRELRPLWNRRGNKGDPEPEDEEEDALPVQ